MTNKNVVGSRYRQTQHMRDQSINEVRREAVARAFLVHQLQGLVSWSTEESAMLCHPKNLASGGSVSLGLNEQHYSIPINVYREA